MKTVCIPLRVSISCQGMLLCLLGALSLPGQDADSRPARGKTDLQLTSGIRLTLSGTQVVSEFRLVDDLGFAYDVMSLLKEEQGRDEIQLRKQQYEEMKAVRDRMNAELLPQVARGVASPESGRKLAEKFRAVELELLEILEPHQVVQLNNLKNRLRLSEFGVTRLMNSRFPENEMDLSAREAEQLRSLARQIERARLEAMRKIHADANLQLIQSLPASCRQAFEVEISSEWRTKFLTEALFVGKPRRSFRKLPEANGVVELLRQPAIREKLDLNVSQYEKVKSFWANHDRTLRLQTAELLEGEGRKLSISQRGKLLVDLQSKNLQDLESSLRGVLLKHQVNQLEELDMSIQVRKHGTAQSLCGGILAEKIGLEEPSARECFQLARSIQQEISRKTRELAESSDQQVLGGIPDLEMARKFEAALGERTR